MVKYTYTWLDIVPFRRKIEGQFPKSKNGKKNVHLLHSLSYNNFAININILKI